MTEGLGDTEALALQQYVTELETQLADTTRQHNEETRGLANEVASLQSRLEQSETERQTLHYQLTLAQKEGRQSTMLLAERESQWNSTQTSLQSELSVLSQQCQDWQTTLDKVQEARAQERMTSQQIIDKKEEEISVKLAQCEDLVAVKRQLESEIEDCKSTIHELQLKLKHSEEEVKLKSDVIQEVSQDLQEKVERGLKQEKDIQNMAHKIKSLESKLGAERAALQDVRFAHDVAQLRLRETEGSLEEERAMAQQLAGDVGEMKETVASIKSSLEDEERRATLLKEQLESKASDYRSLEQHSQEQQVVVADLSHQLQLSKSSLDALRDELNVAKQRRSIMEEKYTGFMREIESLIDEFRVQITKEQSPVENNTSHKRGVPGSPSHVAEKLRVTLIEFRSLLDATKVQVGSTKSQLSNLRQNMKQLSTECSTYREIVTSRTNAMTEADKQLGESAHEIQKLSRQLAHSQAKASSLKKELESLQEGYRQEKDNHQTTLESLDALRHSHSSAMDEHCRFMSLLHEQLRLTASSGSPSDSGHVQPLTSTPLHQPIPPSDWAKLSEAVSTAGLALCEAFKKSRHEAKDMKSTVTKLKSTLESTRSTQKETVCKLTLNHEEQENQWRQRNEQMKTRFEDMLVKAENRAQDVQQRLDSVLLVVAQLEQSKEQLEAQLKKLRETHHVYKNDRACLLSCTCLMAGALFPALSQLQTLSLQKAVLQKQLLESEKLHGSVVEVVKSIDDHVGKHVSSSAQRDGSGDERAQPCAFFPLLKFRKAVIVVIATRRLQMIRSEKRVLFRAKFPRNGHTFQIPVHLGIRDRRTPNASPTTLKSSNFYPENATSSHHTISKDLAGWMRSEKALLGVRESFTDLQTLLDSFTTQQQQLHLKQWQVRGRGPRKDKAPQKTNAVVRPARSAFEKVLEKMVDHFPAVTNSNTASIIHGDSLSYLRLQPKSLCQRLAQGLHAVLGKKPRPLQSYLGSSELGEKLHSQMISLVGRLHETELQTHSLHSQLIQSHSHREDLTRELHEAKKMKENVESLQTELAMMVPHGQFEGICKDLEASLKREKELKIYLSQHVAAVEQLQTKLQLASQDVQSKESSISQSRKEIHELRLNLQHKEHQLSAVSKQLELMDREKVAQAQQLGELQTALAVCRKRMVQEVMSDSLAAGSSVHRQGGVGRKQQLQTPDEGFVPLQQLDGGQTTP